MSKDVYEVYVCKSALGELLYVGSGELGRNKHCNSGRSHVYELNRLHFLEGGLQTEVIVLLDSKEESLIFEEEYIRKHRPKFNRVFLKDERQDIAQKAYSVRKGFEHQLRCEGKSVKYKQQLAELNNEIFKHYRFVDLQSGEIFIYQPHVYKRLDLYHISVLSRYLRYPNLYRENHYCVVYTKRFKERFGVDLFDCLKELKSNL